jgi:hypothetical protein
MIFNPILETPVSRPDNSSTKFAELSWERGLSTFFIDEVPFSWSTGKAFSQIITRYITLLLRYQKTDKKTHCYEMGAGISQLSKNILRQLEEAKVLEDIQFHVSDSMSFDALNFSKETPPHFLILSYIIDSLPHHHLVWEDNEIKEEKGITRLNGTPLLDTSVRPCQCIQSEDIINWAKNKDKAVLLQHLDRLKSCFDEETVLDSHVPISKEEHTLLKTYFEEKNITYCRFNYAKSVITSLKYLFKQAPKTCLWVIQDFGDTSPEGTGKENDLILTYGTCQFFRLYLPLLGYIAEKFKFNVKYSKFPNGKTQHMIIYRGIPKDEVDRVFNETSKTSFTESEIKVDASINKLFLLSNSKEKEFPSKVSTIIKEMNQVDISYSFNLVVAKQYYCINNYLETLHYTTEIIKEYGDFAVSAKLLQGQAHTALGNYKKAQKVLKQAIKTAPFVAELYLQMSIILAKTGEYNQFIDYVYQYMERVKVTPLWTHVVTLIIVLAHQDNGIEMANGYIDELKKYARDGQFNIPENVIESIAALKLQPVT